MWSMNELSILSASTGKSRRKAPWPIAQQKLEAPLKLHAIRDEATHRAAQAQASAAMRGAGNWPRLSTVSVTRVPPSPLATTVANKAMTTSP